MVLGKLSANMPSRKRILEKQEQKGANLASLKCGPNLLFILSKIVVCSGYQRQMTFTCVFPAGGGGGGGGGQGRRNTGGIYGLSSRWLVLGQVLFFTVFMVADTCLWAMKIL